MSNQRPVFFTSTTASGSASADYTHVNFSLQFKAEGQTAAEATKAHENSVREFHDLLDALRLEGAKIAHLVERPYVSRKTEYSKTAKRYVNKGFVAVYSASFQIEDVSKAVDTYARLVELENAGVREPAPKLSSSSLQALQVQAFQNAFSQAKKYVDDELLAIANVMETKEKVEIMMVSYMPQYDHSLSADQNTSYSHTRATMASMRADTVSEPIPFTLGQAQVSCTVTVHWQRHVTLIE